ncbi:hypothetical protein HK405_008944 [Cladochytrium tenue]|nr:hypothetical protein HK405_008944 [Cladochytrium tenue]
MADAAATTTAADASSGPTAAAASGSPSFSSGGGTSFRNTPGPSSMLLLKTTKGIDIADLMHELRSTIASLVKINFAGATDAGHMYLELAEPAHVEDTIKKLAAKGHNCFQASKMTEGAGNFQNRPPGEPSSALSIFLPKSFPKDQLAKVMQRYTGFDRMDGSLKFAHFIDALTASMALEDLLTSTNFGVQFKDVSPSETSADPSLGEPSPFIHVSGTPTSEQIASAEEPERSQWENKLIWGNAGIIACLTNYFRRCKGFKKISFMVNATAAVDFDSVETAERALLRVNEMTKLTAVFGRPRRNDPVQPLLEAPSKNVFLRLTPPGLNLDDAQGFLGFKGYLVRVVNSAPRFAKATFVNVERAMEVLEFVRNNTNLIANFYRGPGEDDGGEFRKRESRVFKKPSIANSMSGNSAGHHEQNESYTAEPTANGPASASNSEHHSKPGKSSGPSGSFKEWPGVCLPSTSLGSSLLLNPLELLGREPGFLRLILESDKSCTGLFETESEAAAALDHISRLIVNPSVLSSGGSPASTATQVTRSMPRPNKGSERDPTDVVSVRFSEGIDETVVEVLLNGVDGIVTTQIRMNTNLHADFSSTLMPQSEPLAKSNNSGRDGFHDDAEGERAGGGGGSYAPRRNSYQPHQGYGGGRGGSWRGGPRGGGGGGGFSNRGGSYGGDGQWGRRGNGNGFRGGRGRDTPPAQHQHQQQAKDDPEARQKKDGAWDVAANDDVGEWD